MSTTAASLAAEGSPCERLEVLFGEVAQLCGQRNAIDGRLVEIVAEIERDELWGATGARSMSALVAWRSCAVSAMPSMGAWSRLSPRSSVTSCGAPPGPGRCRRWWPG
ncbi:DUF222 domain-containing protein, partial [Mycolicibacterium wolinskyi]|nr:DUF222 domain-containing protein [Mycolicibacterium wolinskyi]